MPEIRTEFEIAASPARAWHVLTDFPRYPEWNPFLVRLTGAPEVGARVDVHVKNPLLTVTFRTTVLKVELERELRWRGHLLHDGLVAAEHYFLIEPLAADRLRFVHGERFSGSLSSVAWRLIERDTRRGYAAMNQALTRRAEADG